MIMSMIMSVIIILSINSTIISSSIIIARSIANQKIALLKTTTCAIGMRATGAVARKPEIALGKEATGAR